MLQKRILILLSGLQKMKKMSKRKDIKAVVGDNTISVVNEDENVAKAVEDTELEGRLNLKLNVYLTPPLKTKLFNYVVEDNSKFDKAVQYANILSQQDLNRYLDLKMI